MDFFNVLIGGGAAMLATAVGAAGIFAFKKIESKVYPLILAFSGGVMAFSALEMFNQSHFMAGHVVAFTGLFAGLIALFIMERTIPHAHMLLGKKELEHSKKKALLVAGSITIHNIPEGFAIASAFAVSNPLGWLVTLSIALQDVPEGLVISAPLTYYGLNAKSSFLWGVFSGVVEFLAAIAAFAFLSAIIAATPFALAFSAGAMTYVVLFELLPEALGNNERKNAALVFILGVVIAFVLTVALAFK